MIEPSHDPIWSDSAREIMAGIIIHLQVTKATAWGWKDFVDLAYLPPDQLRAALEHSYPPAARYIEIERQTGLPAKTSSSILVTMLASVARLVMPLAAAWGNHTPDKRFSVSQWVHGEPEDNRGKHVIIQYSALYPELSAAWIGAMIDVIAANVADPSLEESKKRRLWLILDEFPQLGKVKSIPQLLEIGRSKGVACLIAMQDVQQLISTYSEPVAKTILGLLGTKIICRQAAGPGAKYVAEELIGKREVERDATSYTSSTNGNSRSVSSQRETICVVTPDQLSSQIGPDNLGIRALLLNASGVYSLRWPIVNWPRLRKACSPANWLKVQ
jgi:type IV secretory pathway TraG/TraD family ATPase VirD4